MASNPPRIRERRDSRATRRRDVADGETTTHRARASRASRCSRSSRSSRRPRASPRDRVRLPRDARDERLRRRRRAIARRGARPRTPSDARARVGLRATDATRASGSSESRSRRGRTCTETFLTREEAEATIAAARPTMRRSEVVNEADGTSKTSDERTSSGGWVSGEDSEVMANIERRVAAWTMLPRNRGETTQVMRYEAGQEYAAHDDYFHDEVNVKNGGQRAATVLMYLSDVEEGGGDGVSARDAAGGGGAGEERSDARKRVRTRVEGRPERLSGETATRRRAAVLQRAFERRSRRARATRRVPGGARDEVDGDSLAARRRARYRELRAHGFADDLA